MAHHKDSHIRASVEHHHHIMSLSTSENNPGFLAYAQTSAPTVGQPRSFDAGPFAGKTVRAELFELQHADRGRKFVSSDRRVRVHTFASALHRAESLIASRVTLIYCDSVQMR